MLKLLQASAIILSLMFLSGCGGNKDVPTTPKKDVLSKSNKENLEPKKVMSADDMKVALIEELHRGSNLYISKDYLQNYDFWSESLPYINSGWKIWTVIPKDQIPPSISHFAVSVDFENRHLLDADWEFNKINLITDVEYYKKNVVDIDKAARYYEKLYDLIGLPLTLSTGEHIRPYFKNIKMDSSKINEIVKMIKPPKWSETKNTYHCIYFCFQGFDLGEVRVRIDKSSGKIKIDRKIHVKHLFYPGII